MGGVKRGPRLSRNWSILAEGGVKRGPTLSRNWSIVSSEAFLWLNGGYPELTLLPTFGLALYGVAGNEYIELYSWVELRRKLSSSSSESISTFESKKVFWLTVAFLGEGDRDRSGFGFTQVCSFKGSLQSWYWTDGSAAAPLNGQEGESAAELCACGVNGRKHDSASGA